MPSQGLMLSNLRMYDFLQVVGFYSNLRFPCCYDTVVDVVCGLLSKRLLWHLELICVIRPKAMTAP